MKIAGLYISREKTDDDFEEVNKKTIDGMFRWAKANRCKINSREQIHFVCGERQSSMIKISFEIEADTYKKCVEVNNILGAWLRQLFRDISLETVGGTSICHR
jgi:hypothetical protein